MRHDRNEPRKNYGNFKFGWLAVIQILYTTAMGMELRIPEYKVQTSLCTVKPMPAGICSCYGLIYESVKYLVT